MMCGQDTDNKQIKLKKNNNNIVLASESTIEYPLKKCQDIFNVQNCTSSDSL